VSAERFSANWLAAREAADHRSRAPALDRVLGRWWREQAGGHVLDLGSGTGSNIRYLLPVLGAQARWTALDHDDALLETLRRTASCDVDVVVGDLGSEGLSLARQARLVTASALLDLVSASWLDTLVEGCVAAGAAALFVLTYDGSIRWLDDRGVEVESDGDRLVRVAVNHHQRGDKGLGAALGPEAAPALIDRFAARGYDVSSAPSPWRLGPSDEELVGPLLEGWARAAVEQRPDAAPIVERWLSERIALTHAGGWTLEVGHLDVLALPTGPERRGP